MIEIKERLWIICILLLLLSCFVTLYERPSFRENHDSNIGKEISTGNDPMITVKTEKPPITYGVTGSASTGGTIVPSGFSYVSESSDLAFKILANAGNYIQSLTVDGTNHYIANYSFTQHSPVNNGDRNEKVALVDGKRYVFCTNFQSNATFCNDSSYIMVYSADSTWQPIRWISNSTFKAADIYTATYEMAFPDCAIVIGCTNKTGVGFVATFNVTSLIWRYSLYSNSSYLTNFWMTNNNNDIYLQLCSGGYPSLAHTNVTNLFNPDTYDTILDSTSPYKWELRIAYFSGEIYALETNGGSWWRLLSWNVTSKTWGPVLISDLDTSIGPRGIYGYIWADTSMVTITVPDYSAILWRTYYSTDGITWKLAYSIAPVGNFAVKNGDGGSEEHGWSNYIGHNLLAITDTQDNNANSTIAIVDLNGNLINKGVAYLSHDTGARFIQDGNLLVTGQEDCSFTNPFNQCGIKVVTMNCNTINQYTYTLNNVQSEGHNVEAIFRTYIKVTSDDHSIIENSGQVSVTCGSDKSFSYRANAGYYVSHIYVDGSDVRVTGSYTFTNIAQGHTLEIKSAPNTCQIVASPDVNCIIIP